jgi:hypothetical protein
MERKLLTTRGRALYRLRGQTVEPVFGQMKGSQGADRLMVRGLAACAGEWTLHCVAHNLKKLHAHRVRRTANGRRPTLHWSLVDQIGRTAPPAPIIPQLRRHSATGSEVRR